MATKKTAAATKSGAKKQSSAKAATRKSTSQKQAKKSSASEAPAKKTSAKSASKHAGSDPKKYTKPELREKIKAKVTAGEKGGRAGQWSARKAQLVAHEYEAEGGGYKQGRNAAQKSLQAWGDEKWHTADGKQAIQGKVTHRYLPDAAWDKLSPEEKKATDQKKVKGSKRGKQFVSNTAAAAKARKKATKPRS